MKLITIIIFTFWNLLDLVWTYLSVTNEKAIELNILYNTIFNKNIEYFLIFKFIFWFIILWFYLYMYNKFKSNIILYMILIIWIIFIYFWYLNLIYYFW